jgi:CubicO group peptidase (beta-lactamase class C family)
VFTAVAIAQLVDAGKLSFADTIARYLAGFPRERGEKITVHQLLTHTAGIEPMLDPKAFEEMRKANPTTRADQVHFLGARPPVAAPGEKFEYSNAGYMLLEGVVESVVHEPFQDYLRAHVFGPPGMSHTGGGDSTAADMLRFSAALTGGKLVSAKTLAIMMTEQVKTNDPDVGYGYGLEIQTVKGTRVVGHGGGGPGISAQLDIYPDEGYTVVVLSRRPGNTAQRVANRLRELITQR